MVHRLGHLIMAIMWAAAGVFLLPLFSGKGGGGVAATGISQPLKIAYTKTRTALTMTTYSYVVHPAISAPAMPLKPVLEDAGKILVGAGGVQDQLLCRNNTLGAGEVAARCPTGSVMLFDPSSSLFGGKRNNACTPAGCVRSSGTDEGMQEVCVCCTCAYNNAWT